MPLIIIIPWIQNAINDFVECNKGKSNRHDNNYTITSRTRLCTEYHFGRDGENLFKAFEIVWQD